MGKCLSGSHKGSLSLIKGSHRTYISPLPPLLQYLPKINKYPPTINVLHQHCYIYCQLNLHWAGTATLNNTLPHIKLCTATYYIYLWKLAQEHAQSTNCSQLHARTSYETFTLLLYVPSRNIPHTCMNWKCYNQDQI